MFGIDSVAQPMTTDWETLKLLSAKQVCRLLIETFSIYLYIKETISRVQTVSLSVVCLNCPAGGQYTLHNAQNPRLGSPFA